MSTQPSYAAVLRTPLAARTFGAAVIGRFSYGLLPLSLVLAMTASTGSYAVTGGIMALFGLSISVLAPVRALLIDRHGPRRALPPMAILYSLLLLSLTIATWHPSTPGLALGALALAAGACAPPLGPVMRTLWSSLMTGPEAEGGEGGQGLLRRAYSLDTVVEELLFITGPLMAGLIAGITVPAVGVGLSALLVVCGTFGLVSSPAVVKSIRRQAGSAPVVRQLPGRAVIQPMVAALGIGFALGAVSLLMVAFAKLHHDGPAAAWCSAALSAGSALGGLAYSAVSWRMSGGMRLTFLVAVPAVGLAVGGLAPAVWVLALVAAIAGTAISPALSTAYLIADEAAAPNAKTQAGTWVNTAVNGGVAGGSAVPGLLLGHLPIVWCFVIAGSPVAATAAIALLLNIWLSGMRRQINHGRDDVPAQRSRDWSHQNSTAGKDSPSS